MLKKSIVNFSKISDGFFIKFKSPAIIFNSFLNLNIATASKLSLWQSSKNFEKETLFLAAYYLMKTFPDKKIFLYGEDKFSKDFYNKYDLIFLPNYEIEKIKNKNIDLFLNKNSLGEMHKDVVKAYLNIITNCSKYFFHMNHEKWVHTYEDGTSGVLASDYDVPKNKYKLLMRYPDLGHLIYDGGINYNHDIFFYLYEKK